MTIRVLFWTDSREMTQQLEAVIGGRRNPGGPTWINEALLSLESKGNAVNFLWTSAFENKQVPDLTTYCGVGLDLQSYAREHFSTQAGCFISAIYLHFDPNSCPSLAAQRNFRAVKVLAERLGYSSLSICLILRDTAASLSQDLTAFQDFLDFNFWREHLTWPKPQTMKQLVKSLLSQQPDHVQTTPQQPLDLTNDSLARMFQNAEGSYFVAVEKEQKGLVEKLNRLRNEHQVAQNDAEVARQELQTVTIKHDSLLQQLNL
ncbi:hypothetical protein FRC09_016561 [Ceratobasidium sp. 395]|nr:hypothetical protein FRC09_016561 [Ceratobasidium sp. 395]